MDRHKYFSDFKSYMESLSGLEFTKRVRKLVKLAKKSDTEAKECYDNKGYLYSFYSRASIKDIKEFERDFNIKLPTIYVEYLNKLGGMTSPNLDLYPVESLRVMNADSQLSEEDDKQIDEMLRTLSSDEDFKRELLGDDEDEVVTAKAGVGMSWVDKANSIDSEEADKKPVIVIADRRYADKVYFEGFDSIAEALEFQRTVDLEAIHRDSNIEDEEGNVKAGYCVCFSGKNYAHDSDERELRNKIMNISGTAVYCNGKRVASAFDDHVDDGILLVIGSVYCDYYIVLVVGGEHDGEVGIVSWETDILELSRMKFDEWLEYQLIHMICMCDKEQISKHLNTTTSNTTKIAIAVGATAVVGVTAGVILAKICKSKK